ncbi:MAG: 3-isopropylmalate dehydratase small subunit [Pseudomonadota bacterium]
MPDPLIRHTGIAAPLLIDNVDTDQIIPSREMKAVSRTGLAEGLFAGWRYRSPGSREPVPEFVLNRPGFERASVLIAGANFGCGSSREHAVWALAEFGFRVIIAESFNEIFHGNCLRNGVLPVVLKGVSDLRALGWDQATDLTIDLAQQTVERADQPGWQGEFDIDAYPKHLLLEGLDPIGLTLKSADVLDQFEQVDRVARPWVYKDYSAA